MRNIEVAYTGASLAAISFCHFNTGSTHKSFNEFVISICKDCAHIASARYLDTVKMCVNFFQTYFSLLSILIPYYGNNAFMEAKSDVELLSFVRFDVFFIRLTFSLKCD